MADNRTSFRKLLTRGLALMAMLCIYGFSFIGASAVLLGASSTAAQARGGGGFRGGYGGYSPYYGDAGVCYVVRRRVMTPYGWRIRRVSVCE